MSVTIALLTIAWSQQHVQQNVQLAAQKARPKASAAAGSAKITQLLCAGETIIRSNDNRITERLNQSFNIRLDYTKMTADVYGAIPTIGNEWVFHNTRKPLTISNGIARFPGAPLGPDREYSMVEIELQSGAITYRNRHRWLSAFDVIPLYNTFEFGGRCRALSTRAPAIPGP